MIKKKNKENKNKLLSKKHCTEN